MVEISKKKYYNQQKTAFISRKFYILPRFDCSQTQTEYKIWETFLKIELFLSTEGRFEIDEYNMPCYLYECIGPLRVLTMQKTNPKKFKKVKI